MGVSRVIFSELYGAYYNTVAKILAEAVDGTLTNVKMQQIINEYAFSESVLTIIPALKNGDWNLVCGDLTTPIKHKPSMPLTNLQKRWLKAISEDKRMKLFDIDFSFLDGTEPLFTQDDICVFDKYSDGDDFEDEGYIERFRLLLNAAKTQTPVIITVTGKSGKPLRISVLPKRLEYSEKDDKFRLIAAGFKYNQYNLGKITECRYCSGEKLDMSRKSEDEKCEVTFMVTDDRNALERAMLHFAHFEKQTEKKDDKHYLVKLKYYLHDETELIIRILSFGQRVKVLEPQHFVDLIKERLISQLGCELF